MQALNAAPRDNLTVAQVTTLLKTESLTVSAGLELLTPSLVVSADISDDLLEGRVERALYATIHGTCSLRLSRSLAWGVDLVRPYMTLSDGVVTARFNVGVFSLTTPERRILESPATYDVQGFDRLYLLDRQVGDSYSVAAGTDYLTAVSNAITAAGLSGIMLDSSASGTTLPVARTWPIIGEGGPTTWLRIVNDLLQEINYRGVWADENGLFRSQPYVEPSARAPEFTFDADELRTIVGESRTLAEDVWNRPNKWVFIQSNRDPAAAAPTEGAGIYTVTNTPASGELVRTSVVQYEAASQAALVGLGNRRVASDLRVTSVLKLTTGPFPPAGHADIYAVKDVAVGPDRTVQASSWQLDLLGGDTAWTWEKVA